MIHRFFDNLSDQFAGRASSLPWNGLATEGLKVGLLPEKGWARRNARFVRHSLVPAMLRPRCRERGGVQPDFAELSAGEAEITWVGHATFLLRLPGINILIDPNWALWHGFVKRTRQPGCRLDHLPDIDLVLVTHAHFDHLHRPSLRHVANNQPVLVPDGVGSLLRRMPFCEVREMDEWESFRLGGLEIVFTPSCHWGARMVHDTHRGFGGFLIRSPHGTLYHSGDSAYFDGFAEIGKRFDVDTALLPIGAYDAPSGRDVHMNPEEALQAFADLGARRMIPMHYATFPLGNECMGEPLPRLLREAERLGVTDRVLPAREGEPVLLSLDD